MARPPKLTDDVQARIVTLIQSGVFVDVAAEAAGICGATFHRWMQRGDTHTDPATGEVRPPRQPYRAFREAVLRARVEAEAQMVLHLKLAAQAGDWRAAAFWLERTQPARWGRTPTTVVVPPPPPAPPEGPSGPMDLSLLTDAELEVVQRILERMAGAPSVVH